MIHPHDDLAAYALGALSPDEQRAVAAHLEGCDLCRAEVRAFAETAWAIAETAGREAPASMRATILERASSGGRSGARWRARFADGLRRPVPLAVPVVLALLLAVSLAGYAAARRDADRYTAAISGIAGATVVPLVSTGEFPGARGSLVIPANGAAPYLVLDLPAAPTAKTWEAWVVRGDTPVAAGITNDRGVMTLVLTVGIASGDTVAVTLEPSGGLDRPTGKPVLAGKT